MADNLRALTTQEVLNKVYSDSSGNSIGINAATSKETLNAALDTTNSRLNVSLAGGTISGDVTITGDLTVNGSNTNTYDELLEGQLIVRSASAGSVTAHADADDLVVENSAGGGISILTPDGNYGALFFGSPSDSIGAQVSYRQSSTEMLIGTRLSGGILKLRTADGTTALTLDSSQNTTLAGNLVINGSQFDFFRAVNSGNPEFHMGSSDTNKLHIQTVYSSSAQTLNYVTFTTKSSLGSTDAGKMEFYVDEVKKLTIDDAGIDVVGTIDGSGDATFGGDVTISNTDALLNLTSGASGDSVIRFNQTTTQQSTIGYDNTGDLLKINNNSNFGGTNHLVINDSGNIGINTDDPTFFFTAIGDATSDQATINQTHASYAGSALKIGAVRAANSAYNLLYCATGTNAAGTSGTAQFVVTGDGNVEVSTGALKIKTAGQELQWVNGATKLTGADTYLEFNVNSARRFKLDANSRISLSNNDSGGTGGADSTSANTVLGYLAGTIDSGSVRNTFIGHKSGFGTLSDALDNTCVGHGTGIELSQGDNNVLVGSYAGYNINTGSDNVNIGKSAGNAFNSSNTIAIGSLALGSITNAAADGTVAIGYQSLKDLTASPGGTVVGYQSGKNVTTSDYSTALGYNTLGGNSSTALYGNDNTALGANAGRDMEGSAEGNVLVGKDAGMALTTGNFNILIGRDAGQALLDETHNTAIGTDALANSSLVDQTVIVGSQAGMGAMTAAADGTVAVGYGAGKSITSGGGNTLIGFEAMEDITTGTQNTVIGYQALANAQTAVTNVTALGYQVGLRLGDDGASDHSDANIMIGSYTMAGGHDTVANNIANHNIAIGNNALGGGTGTSTAITMAGNTVIGHDASKVATNGADNTIIGKDAAISMTTGYFNTIIGKGANPSAVGGTNQIVIGRATTGTGDNEIALGPTNISAIKAQVTSITAYSSDERTKKNVEDYDLKGVDFIKELNLKTYVYKNPADFPDEIRDSKWDEDGVERLEDPTETQVGLIAQEVESALAKHGVGNTETYAPTQDSGIKTLTYGNLIFPLIKAVQELSARVEEFEKK